MSLPLHAILRSLCDDFRFVNCGIRPTYCRRFVSLLPCNTSATCLVFSYHHGHGWSVCAISIARQTWEWTPNLLLGIAFPFVFTPYAFFISPYLGAKKLLRTNPNLQGTLTY